MIDNPNIPNTNPAADDFEDFMNEVMTIRDNAPAPLPVNTNKANIYVRLYNFRTKTWVNYTSEEARAMSRDTALTHLPNLRTSPTETELMDYYMTVHKPELSAWEVLLLLLLPRG